MNFRSFGLIAFIAALLTPFAMAQQQPKTFTITSAGSPCATVSASNNSTVGLVVLGTWSGTLQPEVSIYGGSANVQNTTVTSTAAGSSPQTTIIASGAYTGNVGGFTQFLLCPTAWTSGTATVQIYATPAVNASLFGTGTGGGTGTLKTCSLPLLCPATNVAFQTTFKTGQLLYFNNGAQPTANSPTVNDCNGGAAVTTTPYVIQVDSGTAVTDRGTVCRFQTGAGTVTVPLSTASGAAGLFIKLIDDGAGALTVNATSTDTFTVCTGGTCLDAQTSYTLANGQFSTMTQGASGIWEATITGSGPGTNNQNVQSNGAGQKFSDFAEQHIIRTAACVNATATPLISGTSTGFTAACRGGTNNLSGVMQAVPSTGGSLSFQWEYPLDSSPVNQPFIAVEWGSGANAAGTVIWTFSSACAGPTGTLTDDPAYIAETAFATKTMTAANRNWAVSGQFTNITSGNNCTGGSLLLIKAAVSGTAASAINVYAFSISMPRRPQVQAN